MAKRMKTENEKATKKDNELAKLKEQLREATVTKRHTNEKLKKELEMYQTGEQHLNVME